MKAALLADRGVVKVTGDAARQFLNSLFTADITKVTAERPCFAALLTPQGKIVVDCIVVEQSAEAGGGFLLDCPRALVGNLVEKLKFYRLRVKVAFEDLSGALGVLAFWDGTGRSAHGLVYPDPRLPELGGRMILPPERAGEAAAELGAELVTADAYEAHRIALGVPRGGIDFVYGDVFPHEADMDQLNGVDFAKGCFVGQEVVARIEHRGSARKRIVQVTAEGSAPEAGLPVMAGERAIGNMGSAAGAQGLAMLRLDHLAEAEANGVPIIAGGVRIHPRKPAWARFDWSQKAAE
ncbi:MAG TPA: folate-binding protein [Xanthobacteraceae bacterium]|nr:folate-binding protein [Xanthobacteraceae bacterium]